MKIDKTTVLVTGSNRGIGRALVAEALTRGAARVYAGARRLVAHSDPRVTPLILDVTNRTQIQQAAAAACELDILINNAGVAMYDDLSEPDTLRRHLDVNTLGPLQVTRAFLPQLKRSRGAIVNVLSLAALAPLPIIPAYSISKAASLSLTQSLRATLAHQGVAVHAVLLGPVDTDMSRDFQIAKVSPEDAARGILDGLERGDEDIFPDPVARTVTDGWRSSVVKALERQNAAFVPAGAE